MVCSPQEQLRKKFQSLQRQGPSNCNMMMIKGAYTLVYAMSANAGNLSILMLCYVTKSGENFEFGSDIGIRRPMRIPGRRVQLCFQKSNWLYFQLDFKLPQFFPSIHPFSISIHLVLCRESLSQHIGPKAGKYPGWMASPSDHFLVCKHPKVKKKDKNSISPVVLRTTVWETSALWIRTSAHMAREPNKFWVNTSVPLLVTLSLCSLQTLCVQPQASS